LPIEALLVTVINSFQSHLTRGHRIAFIEPLASDMVFDIKKIVTHQGIEPATEVVLEGNLPRNFSLIFFNNSQADQFKYSNPLIMFGNFRIRIYYTYGKKSDSLIKGQIVTKIERLFLIILHNRYIINIY
jgi:hypothetical protein